MVSGAALLVRRLPFVELGGFDENIFMYCEDDDLAVRFRQAGLKLGYVGDAIVEHIGGSSSDPTPQLQEFKSYHLMKSTLYATAKHRVEFSRVKKLCTYSLKWAIAACLNRTTRKAEYRGFIRALLGA
jgi:GT2 family glycosyltransferase